MTTATQQISDNRNFVSMDHYSGECVPSVLTTSPGEHLMLQTPSLGLRVAKVVDCIVETSKIISRKLRLGLNELHGEAGRENSSGQQVTRLDDFAHNKIVDSLRGCAPVAMVASEEANEAEEFTRPLNGPYYVVWIDPLDGSSNADVCVPVGTIFSVYEADGKELKSGRKQLVAGYALYGSATVFVYTSGDGVHTFTLNPETDCYSLSSSNIRMPTFGGTYAVNLAYEDSFEPKYRAYMKLLRGGLQGRRFGLRYVGSLVSDFHRILLKGGVFLYPGSKLRLMYEANPLAWIAEQAGGMASDGERPILDIPPNKDIHQRTPLVFGGADEMLAFAEVAERYR